MSPPLRTTARYTPLLVAAVAAVLYLSTLSRHYTGDSIEYALAIELGDPAYLLDPYHPLMHPLGLLFYRLWQALGWTGRALLPLQTLNALAGALCAGLVADMARRLTQSGWLALLTGLGFAISGGLWMLSVEAEFVTPALAAALLVLWMLIAASRAQAGAAWYAVMLALATALAFWSYASGALLVFVAAAGILLDRRTPQSVRQRQLVFYAGALVAVVVPLTLVFLARWSQGDWSRVAAYFVQRGDYSRLAPADIPHGVYGFLRSLALYPRLSLIGTTRQFLSQASTGGRILFAAYYGLALLAACLPPALAVRYRRRWSPGQRRVLVMLAVWSAGYAAFAVFWVPGDVSFWLPVLAAWWLLVAMVASLAAADGQLRWLAGPGVAVVVLALANAAFEVLPRTNLAANHPYQVAAEAAAGTGNGDLFLSRADDISGLYLAYFHNRRVAYVSDQALARLTDVAGSTAGGLERKVYALDGNADRAGWWGQRLAGSGWQVTRVAGQPQDGLLLELAHR